MNGILTKILFESGKFDYAQKTTIISRKNVKKYLAIKFKVHEM